MRLLLDTHTFLWLITGDPRLSLKMLKLLEREGNEKWLSLVSLWEIAIKVGSGKLNLAQPFGVYLSGELNRNGITLLPTEIEHMELLTSLPLHHRDPFDRMIIVQALTEEMPVVSQDAAFDLYKVNRLW